MATQFPRLGQTIPKLDADVDGNFSNNYDATSNFRELLCDKLSDYYSRYLYMRCRMNLMADTVQILTPHFIDLRISSIDALDKGSGISTPATIIQSPTDGAHWSAPNHIFGETTVIGVSEENSDYDYNYKTYFQVWKENKEFEI